MLKVQHPGDQTRWQGGPATAASERGHERAFDLGPVDQRRQPDQRVLHVDLLVQSWAEQLTGLRLRRLRAYRNPRGNLQENRCWRNHTL